MACIIDQITKELYDVEFLAEVCWKERNNLY